MGGWRHLLAAFGLGAMALAVAPSAPARSAPSRAATIATIDAGSVCLRDRSPARLGTLFDTEPGGVIGADYQRALALDDGRVLWTFQDAAIRLGPDEITIVHNIAMLQDGPCFTVLYGGSRAAPEPMFFADRTVPFRRWFWPLDATVGDDGRVYVFAAEMEERGAEYLTETVPVGTWVAAFDVESGAVVEELRPPDASSSLYGWSITSDRTWTYLYAHCYRQFGFDEYALVAAFDRSCATDITVARVPKGRLFDRLDYWDGRRWQPDPERAVPIIDRSGRRINANQFEWTGAGFVSVNKEGDWWGDRIYLSHSPGPTGPFEIYDELAAPTKCPIECNSFFATWVPGRAVDRADGTFVISLAHNRWDGVITSLYRPTFHEVVAPTHLPAGGVFELAVPAGAPAVAITVTSVDADGPGFVTVYPCADGLPVASNLNLHDDPVVANLVVVRPDDDGRVCVYTMSPTDLVVDLAATFPSMDVVRPADRPIRLADTRIGTGGTAGPIEAGHRLRVGVPTLEDGEAALLNVAAVDPIAPGFLTAFPCDRALPPTSNVNVGTAPAVSNLVAVAPDADGDVCIHTHAATDIVVDFVGAVRGPAGEDAERLIDTREVPGGRVGAGATLDVVMPDGATPVLLNVISVGAAAPGFITAHPCDRERPLASNLNYAVSPIVSNLVLVTPSVDGRVCLFTSSATDLVVDHLGSLPTGSSEFVGLPERVADTRNGLGVAGQFGSARGWVPVDG